jgi:hypothetical protein
VCKTIKSRTKKEEKINENLSFVFSSKHANAKCSVTSLSVKELTLAPISVIMRVAQLRVIYCLGFQNGFCFGLNNFLFKFDLNFLQKVTDYLNSPKLAQFNSQFTKYTRKSFWNSIYDYILSILWMTTLKKYSKALAIN